MNNIVIPLVSVLMTAYNREKYIAEAIESVLASSYTNFELIIVDDCSVDNTVAIAKNYEQKDSRVKVFRNEKNLSQFGNRNLAASYAKGMFIKYVDSDDVIYPYTLAMMVQGMQQFPQAALGFCLTDGPCKKPLPYLVEEKEAYQQHFFNGGLLFVGPSGLIIKREAFEMVNGFEEYGMPSDNHLTLKIASKFPVVAMSRDLFWWRMHEGQIFSQNKKNYFNIINNYQYCKDIIINHSPLAAEQNKKILLNLKKNFLLHIYRLIFKKLKPGVAVTLLMQVSKKSKT